MARDEHCKCQMQHICDETMFKAESANQDRCDLTLKYWWDHLGTTNSIASPCSCTASTMWQQLMASQKRRGRRVAEYQ